MFLTKISGRLFGLFYYYNLIFNLHTDLPTYDAQLSQCSALHRVSKCVLGTSKLLILFWTQFLQLITLCNFLPSDQEGWGLIMITLSPLYSVTGFARTTCAISIPLLCAANCFYKTASFFDLDVRLSPPFEAAYNLAQSQFISRSLSLKSVIFCVNCSFHCRIRSVWF